MEGNMFCSTVVTSLLDLSSVVKLFNTSCMRKNITAIISSRGVPLARYAIYYHNSKHSACACITVCGCHDYQLMASENFVVLNPQIFFSPWAAR